MKTMKKALSVLLVVAMVATLFAGIFSVSAADGDTKTSGKYEYTLINDGNDVKIVKYNGDERNVIIPSRIEGKKVRVIGENAFVGASRMTTVYFARTINTIEAGAFRGCGRLEWLSIPGCIKNIGDYAFANCGRIWFVVMYNGVENLGKGVFESCGRLESIKLPASVKAVPDYAFFNCGRLEKANIKGGTTIGANAFASCRRLDSVTLAKSITEIGDNAFAGTPRFSKLYFYGNAPKLGANVFMLSGLNDIYIKNGKGGYDGAAWAKFEKHTFYV